ncbi:MAG: hypothetical protein EOO02_19690 [Chitinophagaceae bacterium]|nr:MAG: hypothetical protein EOO02_19690 [Chitinophagaceae bacterium]
MSPENRNTNEEIDLFHFLRPVTRPVGNYLNLLYARRILFITIFIICSIAAFLCKGLIPRSYSVTGVFVSNILPGSYIDKVTGSLNSMLTSGRNSEILAPRMRISPAMISEIQAVKLIDHIDSFNVTKRDSLSTMFQLEVRVTSTNNIDSIQKGILGFLENDSFALKIGATRAVTMAALYEDFQKKISSLDTVKKIVNSSIIPRGSGNGIIYGEPLNPVDIYDAETKYYRELLQLREQMSFLNGIQIMQPLLKRNDYNYPDLKFFPVYAVLFGLVMALLIVPIFEQFRK